MGALEVAERTLAQANQLVPQEIALIDEQRIKASVKRVLGGSLAGHLDRTSDSDSVYRYAAEILDSNNLFAKRD
jgi:hypothetical protein